MKAKLREIKETLRQHRHKPIDEQGRWLATVIKGYFAYFAVPTNTYLLSAFRYHISMKWFQSLRRRSQRHRLTWKRMTQLIDRFLPSPCVLHPWPVIKPSLARATDAGKDWHSARRSPHGGRARRYCPRRAGLPVESGGQVKMTFTGNISSLGYLTGEEAKLNAIVRAKGGASLHSWSFDISVK